MDRHDARDQHRAVSDGNTNNIAAVCPGTPTNAQNRFAHIDALRAVAVTIVLIQHSGISIVPGDSGVMVFFAISGFIITTVLMRERERTGGFRVRRFYLRRALKLGPPFLVAIFIPTLIYSLFEHVSWLAVLSQLLFSYNWVQIYANESSGQVLPGSNVVWSLAVEEQFYIGFALVWVVLVRLSRWRMLLTVFSISLIIYATAARIFLIVSYSGEHLVRGTDVRMDAIAWGVLAAIAYERYSAGQAQRLRALANDWVPPVAVGAILVASGVNFDRYESLWRSIAIPLATAAVIIYGLIPTGSAVQRRIYNVSTWKPVALVGLASYSIYISHYVVIYPLEQSWSSPPLLVRFPIALILGLSVGLALYNLVEKPVLTFRERHGL